MDELVTWFANESNHCNINNVIKDVSLLYKNKHKEVSIEKAFIYKAQIKVADCELPVVIKSSVYYKEIKREFKVGLHVNKLRSTIPNFMQTYGAIRAGEMKNGKIEQGTSHYYIFLEYIPGISICNELSTSKIKTFSDFLNIFCQLLLALEVAQREMHFCHLDLHSNNVLIHRYKEAVEYMVCIDNRVYTVTTNMIPVIIDYGFASIEIDDIILSENHRHKQPSKDGYKISKAGMRLENQGVLPYLIQGIDMYRLLSTCIKYTLHDRILPYQIVKLFEFYGYDDPYNISIDNHRICVNEFGKRVPYSRAGSYSPLSFLSNIDPFPTCIKITARDRFIHNYNISDKNFDALLETVQEYVNSSQSFILGQYAVYLLKQKNLQEQASVLIDWLNKNEIELKQNDRVFLDTPINFSMPTNILNKCIQILDVTTVLVNRFTVEQIKAFRNSMEVIDEIEERMLYYYMCMEAGIENDKLDAFVRSDTFFVYCDVVDVVKQALRWCWTLEQELKYIL